MERPVTHPPDRETKEFLCVQRGMKERKQGSDRGCQGGEGTAGDWAGQGGFFEEVAFELSPGGMKRSAPC